MGRLDQFLECFSVFSHPPLPFFIIFSLLLLSLFLLLFVITVIIIWLGLGVVGGGWAGRAGLWGALATWVFRTEIWCVVDWVRVGNQTKKLDVRVEERMCNLLIYVVFME